ncbi:hypothetical protein SELMODRAFT_119297 [Selaginella moellendorffii]|uniref:HECT-type E3 ubiquitin transferase n=1 Tax=Selaginella moellendorffii TaxID=88036 RepID=D8SL29_SELML|nr:hypothetical protein SELMODRAFT_119297 [Selaginella moellendorffii]
MEDKHEFLLSKFPISESEEIRIHRHDILKDSYEELGQRSAEKLKKFQLSVHFRGEEGEGEGLGREWFQVVSQAIVEEQALLFSPVGDCYQPNPSSASCPGHLSYFKFVGRLAAKAIIDSQKLDIRFTRSFYKHILGREVTYMDMEPEVSKSLVWLLENKVEESMGLSFSIDDHSDGRKEMAIHDLIPGGRDVPVTEENKHDYVNHVADYRLTGSIKPQIDAFLDGFYELISKDLISIFDVKELELLMSGPPDVDVEELQKVARCEHTYCILKWFWDAVNGFCKEDKVRLLKFMTGSSKISNTGILITEGGEWNQLPTAYTCSGTIVLPHYQSREQLEEKLLLAIREGCEGFGFV